MHIFLHSLLIAPSPLPVFPTWGCALNFWPQQHWVGGRWGAFPGAGKNALFFPLILQTGFNSNSIHYFGGNHLFRPSPSWCFREYSSSAVSQVGAQVVLCAAGAGAEGSAATCTFMYLLEFSTLWRCLFLGTGSARIHVVFRMFVLRCECAMGRNMSVPAQPTWLAACRPARAAFFRGMKIRLCFPSHVWRKQRREWDLISPRLLGSSCTGGLGAVCLASNTSVRGWFQLFAGRVAGGDATTRPSSVLTRLGDHQG